MEKQRFNTLTQTLQTLRQAVAMLEETAAHHDAQRHDEAVAEITRLAQSLSTIQQHLEQAVQKDQSLRHAVAHLGRWLSSLAETPQRDDEKAQRSEARAAAEAAGTSASTIASDSDVEHRARPGSSKVAPAASQRSAPPAPTQEVPLMIGGAATTINVPGTAEEAKAARQATERPDNGGWSVSPSSPIAAPAPPIDLAMIAKRCRVKEEACQWAAEFRDPWEDDHPDAVLRKARYDDIIARARALPDCYAWALNSRLAIPGFKRMMAYARGYRNLALACELAESIRRDGPRGGDWLESAYALLAEAQSALRAALEQDGLFNDNDQEEAFRWLRHRTSEDRVLIARHMKLEDPADLENADDLAARLDALRSRLNKLRSQESHRRAMLNKARYHARKLRENQSSDAMADWCTVVESVHASVEAGTPASDPDVRDLLMPIIDQLPDELELPAGFERVMDAIDAHIAAAEIEEEEPHLHPRAVSAEVEEVARLLEGKVVVLIGGQCRDASKRALEREFRLAELRWIPARHHQSHYLFEAAIARPETALVMLAIRWSSHSFENVDELCRKYGKPYVRLPGGYSPNQVASQILAQVSDQLRNDLTQNE